MIFLKLPPDLTIKPHYELRERFERRLESDFTNLKADNRSTLLSRGRIGAEFKFKEISGEIAYQYAQATNQSPAGNNSTDRSDLVRGYLSLPVAKGTLTVGRQPLKIGTERLLGDLNWNNVSIGFDLVRFKHGLWDLFAGSGGVLPFPSRDLRIAGVTRTEGKGQTLLVYKHDRTTGSIDHFTLSQLGKSRRGRLTGEGEIAGQLGANNGRRVEAWAFNAKATYSLNKVLDVYLEANAASGGQRDGRHSTFDQLYASAHERYGLLDLAGWENIQIATLAVKYHPSPKLDVKVQYLQLALRDPSDNWYNALGKPNRGRFGALVDPTGASGRDLGRELDLDATFRVSKTHAFQAGIGMFQPGNYVRKLNQGSADNQIWGYVQWTTKF